MGDTVEERLAFLGYFSCPRGLENEEAHSLLGLVHRIYDGHRVCIVHELAQREDIRLKPPVSNPPADSNMQRGYTYGGTRSHLLPPLTNLTAAPYTPAFCGFSPEWPSSWLGTGSQDEIDTAVTQPLCRSCDRIIRGRRDLRL